jgi:hypothetical protein
MLIIRLKNPLNILTLLFLHYFRSNIKTGYIWLEGVLNNRLDDPSIAGIITNFRDITNQINIELKLKQREQRFQALIENNEGIISLVIEIRKVYFVPHPLSD